MKCTKCGFELDENANFCSNCGTPVVHEAASEATSAKEALPEETVTEETADAPEISEKTEDKATLDEELDALLEQLIGNALDIVAINKAQTRKRLHAQDRLQLVQELPRLDIETGLFLNINARNHESYPSLLCWVPFPACFERKMHFKALLKQFLS